MFPSLAHPTRLFLIGEFALIFVATPLILFPHPTRLSMFMALWGITAYAATILSRTPNFSWRVEWCGDTLTPHYRKIIVARFVFSTLGLILLTYIFAPSLSFSFPLQRPFFWLIIMVLYPFLSALPQEVIFRSFFFRRYTALFPRPWMLVAASAIAFGFIHIIFHNPVSPLLSAICGLFLASSYARHASLKKAAVEHALYGDMVFTVGLGIYFVMNPYFLGH